MENKNSNYRTITYLPGTNSHNKDFSEIDDVLSDILHNHKNIKLLIVGKLDVDEKMFPRHRIARLNWIDYFKLPQIIANSSVTLAPLVRSPFTYAKSHIKYVESAAFGTPAICSPTDDICRHQSKGLHIASTTFQWKKAINHVLDNPLDKTTRRRLEKTVQSTAAAELSVERFLASIGNVNSESFKAVVGH
ncbi:glycosyltransferase [bacterium]|nr:glycosyltransferase [bacterium]